MFKFSVIFAIIICFYLKKCWSYSIPTPTFELLSPKGFRISIPDDDGIVLFAFHANINREIRGIQEGEISGESTMPIDNRWVYENRKVILDAGDILYYWVHVQHGNRAYRLLEKSFTVTSVPGDSNSFNYESATRRTTVRTRPTASTETQTRPAGMDCQISETTTRGHNVCKGALIFEDEFNRFDWNKWQREIRIPSDSDDADFVSFQNRPENCYISGGVLNIVPNLLTEVPGFTEEDIRSGELDLGTECTGIENVERQCKRKAELFRILPPVVSAKIRTKDFFSFRYGRVVVRAKLTKGDWLFPLIVLEPLSNYYGSSGYASGQMRVAFIRGNENLDNKLGNQIDGHRLSGGVVLSTGDINRDIWLKSSLRADHLGNDFHVYTMIWTDQSITMSIDGNDYATIRGGFRDIYQTHNISHAQGWNQGEYMAPFDKEFYVSLGVSAGGISDFPDGSRTGPERQMKPWANRSPKAELKFWNNRDSWHRTWNGEDAGMKIDYIKVYAL